MTDSNPLVLYDISSPREPQSYAPNPSKTRLALSLKCVSFKTTWVDILNIPEIRKRLNCPAVRKLDDGSDYFTLPILRNPTTGNKTIGDSFDIANYLDETFPDSGGRLFPPKSTLTGLDYMSPNSDTAFFAPLSSVCESNNAAYARFNQQVDATFSAYVVLVAENIPFNSESAEGVRSLFVKRAHLNSWDDLSIRGEPRKQLKASFKGALASLAQYFAVHDVGPYLEGRQANYADLIVGGWLNMMSATMPEEEWKDFRTWHGGVFGKLHDALQENYWVC